MESFCRQVGVRLTSDPLEALQRCRCFGIFLLGSFFCIIISILSEAHAAACIAFED
jgi:hypothetical protein